MNREELQNFIAEKYGVLPEYPWASSPSFAVFRHDNNKKLFAVVMTITKDKLGLNSTENIDVVNLKCDPLMNVITEDGIFPAYHMSKTHWISVVLDGSVDEDKIKWLLNLSFELTGRVSYPNLPKRSCK